MGNGIVQTSENVTLVGASPTNTGILDFALTFAPRLIAVDGGTEMARKYGKAPELLLGDMDSVQPATLAEIDPERVLHVLDQDTTDFDKALRLVAAPIILGVGFLGGRVDHQMAALNSLARHRAAPVILLGEEDAIFRVPDHLALDLDPGTRISLHPLMQARVDTKGLRWPVTDAVMSADGFFSQSNEAATRDVVLGAVGDVLAFLPRQALAAVVAAFTRSRQTT